MYNQLMKLFCPNCNSVYDVKNYPNTGIGLTVKCYLCDQEWFHYNYAGQIEIIAAKEKSLRELANEEYQFAQNTTGVGSQSIKTDLSHEQIQNRIKESSDRVKENKALASNNEVNLIQAIREKHQWTVFGFLTASLLYGILSVTFFLNSQLQEIFPSQHKILIQYKIIVEELINGLQSFWSRIFQFFN